MNTMKKVGSIAISVVLWAIILIAALFAFTTLATNSNGEVKSLFGFTPMTVQSDSMVPTFAKGDLIVIKKCDTSTLKEGDIITFHTIIQNEYALNTHRIDKIEEQNGARSYTTKGDNNDMADTHFIADGDIVGEYKFKVSGFGKVMDFLSGSVGFLVVIVLPLLLFFIYQIYHLVMVSMNLKKAIAAEEAEKKAEEISASTEEAAKAKEEAEAALLEAKRLKEEAEALKAEALKAKEEAASASSDESSENSSSEA